MFTGRCLCGEVSWELLAQPHSLYNCHCRICQKAHGAAFGTYAFVKSDDFRWTSDTKTVVQYSFSDEVTRSSCSNCGSVVPWASKHADNTVAPAGCHDQLRTPDYNIFVPDKAPWNTIGNNLPACDAYPEESGRPSVEGLPVPGKPEGNVRGSCLCGDITYEVTEPFKLARHCHCQRCRQGRSAAHATNGFVSFDGLQYLTGEEKLKNYKVPDARFFTQTFCETCSSLMPRKDAGRGIAVIPMSSLDDDPGIRPQDHIFVEYKADWHHITDELPQHREGPPA